MIRLDGVGLKQGAFELSDVTFEIPEGAAHALMGPSGSGKTTLMEVVCGLRPISEGRIVVGDRDVGLLKPAERGIGYVPQDGALFPTMTVREHLAFALRLRRWTASEIAQRVDELSELLGLGELLDRVPTGLSGGEVQRVAVGRALSYHPRVLCLDEPFSALDDDTRREMHELMAEVRAATRCTVLLVTHNLREAKSMADRILRIESGRVVPVDEHPTDLVRPAS